MYKYVQTAHKYCILFVISPMPTSQQNPSLPGQVPCDLALKILHRIPAEHRHSITPQQMVAIQSVLRERQQKTIFRTALGPFCLSLTAGRKRSKKRLNQSLLAPALCLMASMIGMGSMVGLMKFRYDYQIAAYTKATLPIEKASVHPTVLPFRKGQNTCEKYGGVWTREECVAHTHDPTF